MLRENVIQQRKRVRNEWRNEWNNMLIVRDSEHDVSQCVDQPWEMMIGWCNMLVRWVGIWGLYLPQPNNTNVQKF